MSPHVRETAFMLHFCGYTSGINRCLMILKSSLHSLQFLQQIFIIIAQRVASIIGIENGLHISQEDKLDNYSHINVV